jgi:peptide/nickel transport system ATP-binding protein
MVEYGPFRDVIENPLHPYTQALIEALPDPDPANRFKIRKVPPGEPPSLLNPPSGCRFHPRCPYVIKGKCEKEEPPLKEVRRGHYVACWLY